MKILKYNLCTLVNCGTERKPKWEEVLTPVEMDWNEANEEIAKRESHNGEYTIEEDGQAEPVEEPTPEELIADQEKRIKELEEALELLLSGATE